MAESEASGADINFDTSWDIEKYFNLHEPPGHWEMKKKFMEKNKDKFSEARLVCLASTFLNAEVMGCSYNPQTMNLLEELSKGIVEEYRERKKQRVQKVFVKASDAAASKIRAGNTDTKKPYSKPIRTAAQAREGLERAFAGGAESLSTVRDVEIQQPEEQHQFRSKFTQGMKNSKSKKDQQVWQMDIPKECQTCYGYFVLVEDEGTNILPRQILERSASLCQANISIKEGMSAKDEMIVNISINDKPLASVKDVPPKKAREVAFQTALEKLQEVCYTIKIKNRQYSDAPVGRDFCESDGEKVKEESHSSAEQPHSSAEAPAGTGKEDAFSSKALRMMANMGWTGGGLGKAEQGITEPIRLEVSKNRGGVGSKDKDDKKKKEITPQEEFRAKAAVFLQNYAYSDTEEDLIFTTEFSNEERKILHQLAAKYDLKSRSYGKQAGRHLVISRKIEPFALARALLTPGYKSQKYELLKPTGPKNIL